MTALRHPPHVAPLEERERLLRAGELVLALEARGYRVELPHRARSVRLLAGDGTPMARVPRKIALALAAQRAGLIALLRPCTRCGERTPIATGVVCPRSGRPAACPVEPPPRPGQLAATRLRGLRPPARAPEASEARDVDASVSRASRHLRLVGGAGCENESGKEHYGTQTDAEARPPVHVLYQAPIAARS